MHIEMRPNCVLQINEANILPWVEWVRLCAASTARTFKQPVRLDL
jgi:hypothetical protein